MILILLALLGAALLLGPVVVPAVLHVQITGGATAILMLFGVALLVGSAALGVVSRLYVRTSASAALVRTGMGGMRVVKDGGILFIPVIHNVIRVTLQTVKLAVERRDTDALITHDKLRADVHAEFFVRVQPDDESIINASRSFGERMDPASIKMVVEDKLVSALRQVAATKTLEDLNSKRDEFMREVRNVLTEDIKANGLTLETATISRLDQTNPKSLRDDNIFDAQGARAIAEITQKQLTERNALLRQGEQARTQQDVATRQQILQLEQARTQAEMVQMTNVATVKAEQGMIAQRKQLEAEQAVKLAQVEQVQAVQLAQVKQDQEVKLAQVQQTQAIAEAQVRQDQAVKLAQVEQERAVKLAQVQQTQAFEIADREKGTRVAQAEQDKALAEAKRADAEAERAKALQSVMTVEVQAQAERSRNQKIIEAEATAGQRLIEAQRAADAKAYTIQKEAEAQRTSASASAEAVLKKAQADSQAQTLRADGMRAEALVPVEVAKKQVEVDQQRVAVLQQEMQARAEHGAAQQEFELAKLKIEASARVQVETAKATVNILGKISANVYGTPEDVAKMSKLWLNGMGLAQMVEGGMAGVGDLTRAAARHIADEAKSALLESKTPELPAKSA